MNEEINLWLNSERDYLEGLALYDKHGSSNNLKRILRIAGPSKKNLDTLVYELGKLAKVAPSKVGAVVARPVVISTGVSKIEVKKPTPSVQFVPKVERVGLRPNTPEVDALVKKVIDLQKVGSSLHSSLSFLDNEKDRANIAGQILDLYEEVDDIYDRLRVYDKTGSLPPSGIKAPKAEKPPVSKMDIQQLMIRQSTLRSLISKAKKREKTAVKLETRANNIRIRERYELELASIEELLRK